MIGMETVIGLGIMAAALLLVVLVQAVLLGSLNRKNKRLVLTNNGLYEKLITAQNEANQLASVLERKLDTVDKVASSISELDVPKSVKVRLVGELKQC